MAMSKKDYELIAGVFSEHVKSYREQGHTKEISDKINAIGTVVSALARELEIENPRFTHDRFVTACGFTRLSWVGR
jgi:hypothetical protein